MADIKGLKQLCQLQIFFNYISLDAREIKIKWVYRINPERLKRLDHGGGVLAKTGEAPAGIAPRAEPLGQSANQVLVCVLVDFVGQRLSGFGNGYLAAEDVVTVSA